MLEATRRVMGRTIWIFPELSTRAFWTLGDEFDGTSADCNGNGVPDECDLADGSSTDLNGNGIPDECEPDCNGNGIPDDLDLADGTSSDCNTNKVPDECETDCLYLQRLRERTRRV